MEIHLLASTASRVRAALGDDVDLSPAAVPAVLARLAVESPAVYSQVLAEISGSEVRLDSERELARRRRRGLLRRALFGWGEYESEAGDRLVAKRRVAAAVPLGLAALTLAFLLASGVGHRHAARGHGTPAASRPSGARPAAAPLPALPDLPAAGPAPAGLPSPAPAGAPAGPARGVGAPVGPIVFTDRQAPGASGALPGIRPEPAATPIVYDRAAEERRAARLDPGQRGAAPVLDLSSSGAAPAAEPDGRARAAGSHPGWTLGQRVPARLATGVVAVAGGPPVPVIAESDDPAATWLGRASLGPDGLLQVALSPVAPAAPSAVRGVALDPDRLAPGLAGRTALRHPRAAGAAVAAALAAAGDYVRALAQQGQVTVTNGWAEIAAGGPGPAWTYLAARLAQGMDPGGRAEAPVETTEVAAGTRLVILVTEAP